MNIIKRHQGQIILGLTTLLGLIFRIINTYTRVPSGDSSHFTLHAINFLNSGLLVTWDQSTFLWYAITDIFYKFLGITQFASRFSSVLFGTATIILVYLFVFEFSGNRRLALISSMLYSFTPTFIFHAADEHDVSTLFFIFLIFYFLIYGLKRDSKTYLILSGVYFGVASMWKAYIPLFIIPYIGLIIYFNKTNRFNLKKHLKTFFYIILIIGLLVMPVLSYNYLNYKHNQVPTFFFVKFFKGLSNPTTDSLYGWVSGGELNRKGNFFSRVFIDGSPDNPVNHNSLLYDGLTYSLYANGHLLSIGALLSIIFLFIKRKKDVFAKDYLYFYLLYFLIPFLFLIDGNILHKHYFNFLAMAIPAISYLLLSLFNYFSTKVNAIKKIENHSFVIFMLIIIYVFFVTLSIVNPTWGALFSKNPEGQLISYKDSSIPKESLIIYDDRIYNSLAGWLFNDRYYIPVSFLNQFMSYNQNSSLRRNIPIYIVECVIDDCGWGTVSANPTLNESMEGFFSSVKNQSIPVVFSAHKKLTGVKYYNPLVSKETETETFIVYKTGMSIDLNLAREVKRQYNYFLYPTGYENKADPIFTKFVYVPEGAFEILIDKLAWFVFYLEIFLSFLAIFWVAYEAYIYI